MWKKILLIGIAFTLLLLAVDLSTRPAAKTILRYTVNLGPCRECLCLPFLIPAPERRTVVYRNPMFGLDIESVEADGTPINPTESIVYYNKYPDAEKTPIEGLGHIYQVQLGLVDSGRDCELTVFAPVVGNDPLVHRTFRFPVAAKGIAVRYRVIYGDDQIGESIELMIGKSTGVKAGLGKEG